MEDSIAVKFSKLQEEYLFAGLEKDISDELSWIEDNIAVCQSEENYDNVISVQVLQKKLQVNQTEKLIETKQFHRTYFLFILGRVRRYDRKISQAEYFLSCFFVTQEVMGYMKNLISGSIVSTFVTMQISFNNRQ